MSNPQAGRQPLVGYPLVLIQYICSYPPYLEDVTSISSLRTCHAMVSRDTPNMEFKTTGARNFFPAMNMFIYINILFLILLDFWPFTME
jgi:hypothetical protein